MIEFSLATRQAIPLCPFHARHPAARDVACVLVVNAGAGRADLVSNNPLDKGPGHS